MREDLPNGETELEGEEEEDGVTLINIPSESEKQAIESARKLRAIVSEEVVRLD